MNMQRFLNIMISLMIVLLPACSSVEKLAYHIDIKQGNYLDSKAIEQLKLGMSKEQVRYLLGSPMLRENSMPNVWYYISHQTHSHDPAIQKNLILTFDDHSQHLSKIDRSQLAPMIKEK